MNRRSLNHFIAAVVLAVSVFFSFSPSLKAGFLNWDDDINILENSAVRSLQFSNIKNIFAQSVQKIYIPLTTLTYAVEYYWVGYEPFLYHFNNVLLHCLNTVLVYLIASRLGMAWGGALVAALLFGIHPMKVESVAWVTERKDVLYAFFYLLALLSYIRDLQCRGTAGRTPTGFYLLTIAFGVLSLLAKPMALSLPLVLFLMDWFSERKLSRQAFIEKIPFFLYIIPITWITYAQHVRNPITDFGSAALTWIWTFVFYIGKFIAPMVLMPLYRMPYPPSIREIEFLIPVIVFVALVTSVVMFRKNRWWIFAVGYYVLSIFFLMRFDVGVDMNVVADRFMYLPCLGFCLAVGYGIAQIAKANPRIYILCAVVGCLLMAKTFTQTKIWQEPMTLWGYVIANDAQSHVGYNNRGNIYNERDSLNEAMEDYNQALAINPKFARAFNNRGIVYAKAGRNHEALADFNSAVEFKPDFEKAYYNRSVIKDRFGQYREALVDARRAGELGAPVPADYLSGLEKKAASAP